MEITGLMSAATGLLSSANGTMLIFLFFLVTVGVILFLSKLFNLVLMYVSVAIISALAPFLINMFSSSLFGTNVFNISSYLIITFMVFGTVGIFVYKGISFVLGIAEGIVHTSTHALRKHNDKKHKHEEHKEHYKDDE